MATVKIPSPLRKLTGDRRAVKAAGKTLGEVINDLDRQYPGMKARVLDADGKVLSFVNIFVDEQDIRLMQGLATPVAETTEVSIIPAMAGGN